MFIYRFRMNFEEQDGFFRDVELVTDQTFMDFHEVIRDNLSLDQNVECAFYLCDHRFRKKKQIHQHISTKKSSAEDDGSEKKLYMEQCTLSDFIDDPHQKFIYIYDISKEWTFFIELLKIRPAEKGKSYPAVVSAVGGVPIEISRKPVPLPGVSDDEDDEEDSHEEDENVMEQQNEAVYGEEDMDEFDDSGFYDDSIEIGEDFDEGKS